MRFHVDARLVPGSEIAPWLVDEQRRIRELHEEGFIELLWRRTDGTGAWLVVSAQNEDAATRRLATLPFVAVGIMTMELSAVDAVDIDTL